MSRGGSESTQASKHVDIARFGLFVSGMYGTGHVCQAFLYLTSVFWHQFYAENLYFFRHLFKWADVLTLMASMIYILRSVQTIKRRNNTMKRLDEMQRGRQHDFVVPPRLPDVYNIT